MSHINNNTSRYQIEQIIRHRLHRGYYNYVEYFVKWKNFGASENSWEHEDDLEEDEEETIREYWERTKFGSKEKAFELEEENPEARSYSIQKDSYKEILVISSDDDDDDDDIDLFKKKQKEKQVKEQLYVKEEEKERISLLFKKPVFGCPVTVIEISDDDDDDKNDDDNNKEEEEKEEEEKGWKVKEEEQRMELEFESEDGIIDNPKYRTYYDDWEERVNGILAVQKHVKYNIYKCLLEWNDGKCCIYPLNTIKEKCPQKLIDYYESILVIE